MHSADSPQQVSSLKLSLRPSNPFSHPLTGAIVEDNGTKILIKITRFNDRNPPVITILGSVTKTCRFRGLADFQFSPDPDGPIPCLVNSLHTRCIESIGTFQLAPSLNLQYLKDCEMIPPPLFSRIDVPFNYQFRQCAGVVPVMVGSGEHQRVEMINRAPKYKFLIVEHLFSSETVPTSPPPELMIYKEQLDSSLLAFYVNLFSQRPIWSRQALLSQHTDISEPKMKQLVPFVAYLSTNGPWRSCFVRYGYDPRQNLAAWEYQLVDVRNVNAGRKDRAISSQKYLKLHVFDDAFARSGLNGFIRFQVCDIIHPLIHHLIHTPHRNRAKCNVSSRCDADVLGA